MAAVSASSSRFGPERRRCTLPASRFWIGPISSALTTASTPASTHTWVDTLRTLMPANDAALGLSAAERTARPKRVR